MVWQQCCISLPPKVSNLIFIQLQQQQLNFQRIIKLYILMPFPDNLLDRIEGQGDEQERF